MDKPDLSNYLVVGRKTSDCFQLTCVVVKNSKSCTFRRTLKSSELSRLNTIAATHSTECVLRNGNGTKSS